MFVVISVQNKPKTEINCFPNAIGMHGARMNKMMHEDDEDAYVFETQYSADSQIWDLEKGQ